MIYFNKPIPAIVQIGKELRKQLQVNLGDTIRLTFDGRLRWYKIITGYKCIDFFII